MNDIEHNLTGYLSTVALINIAVGICGGVAAWVAGLRDPVAWAVLAFILNFVPYIGALIMEAALFMVGLVTFPTLTHALLAPLLFLGLATLEGHFITPSIMGHRLTLNPLTVFLSLVLDLAVGARRRVSGSAATDYGAGRGRSPVSRG